MRVAAVLALTVLLAVPSVASGAADRPLERKLEPLLELGISGAQVNAGGRTAAVGVADRATERRMRANLSFRAGSITKSFTATVVLQLVAERRLRLADTVERRLPGVLPYGGDVTIRNLLQHTSGVPDYWEAGPDPLNLSFVNDAAARRTYAPLELVERVSGLPPDFAAGRRVEYSNTNYVLLGLIVEGLTGRSLERQVGQRILRPLRLRHTRFPVSGTGLVRPFTHGYSQLFDDEGLPAPGAPVDLTEYDPTALWAMGNLVSTLQDLRRFYRALLGGRLLPPRLTRLMQQTRPNQTAEWPEGIGMGLGIWSWDLPCGKRVYGHEGEVPGSNTWAFGTRRGRRMVVLQHNGFYLDWDQWFETVMPTYFSFWCR